MSYNDVPSDGVNPRRFDKFVIDKCLVYNQVAEGADGTIQKVVNVQNVIMIKVVFHVIMDIIK